MPDKAEKNDKEEIKGVFGWFIAIFGMQYLAIPLHGLLGLSQPVTLAVSTLFMGAWIMIWFGRGLMSVKSYVLFICLLAAGGYAYMKLVTQSR